MLGKPSPLPKTQQRHRQGHLIQAHIPSLSNCKYTIEEPSSLHNSKHIKHTQAIRLQNTTLYIDNITHNKLHRSKGVQHTTQKATTDQHSRHNHKVYRNLHQETQSLHNIQKPHSHTTSI